LEQSIRGKPWEWDFKKGGFEGEKKTVDPKAGKVSEKKVEKKKKKKGENAA